MATRRFHAMKSRLIVLSLLAFLVLAGAAVAGGHAFIRGTKGDDNITGTQYRDRIVALAGNDTVNALEGNDRVWAGPGNDTVDCGPGNDVVWVNSAESDSYSNCEVVKTVTVTTSSG